MPVDPRPFSYEYRKPRFLNPTLYSSIHSVSPAISTKASTTATPNNPTTTSLKECPFATNQTHACPDPSSTAIKNPLAISQNLRKEKQHMNYPNHHRQIGIPKKMKAIDFPPSARLLNADSPNWAAICKVVFRATTWPNGVRGLSDFVSTSDSRSPSTS